MMLVVFCLLLRVCNTGVLKVCVCVCVRNMMLAERCALLSAEILKSQAKYSDAATLLIKMTSEVSSNLVQSF